MFNTVRSPPGVDDVVDDDYDDRDGAVEVQTNYIRSQNVSFIVLITNVLLLFDKWAHLSNIDYG